jgi:hypothetical protein
MSTDPVVTIDDVKAAEQAVEDAEAKRDRDIALYHQKVADVFNGKKGFDLVIAILYSLMANYPDGLPDDQTKSDATISGFFEDRIAVSGDGLVLMGKLTQFVNGMENKFNDKNGTTDDLRAFAKEADAFLDASDPNSGFLKSIPPATLSAARQKILEMRQDIKITGDDKYNPAPGQKYHLTDDASDTTASHSFGELFTNAQKTDDTTDAKDCIQTFTQGFQLTTSVFDGANSSLKLHVDQDTNDYKNMESFFVSFGQDFFKPSDTSVNNQKN